MARTPRWVMSSWLAFTLLGPMAGGVSASNVSVPVVTVLHGERVPVKGAYVSSWANPSGGEYPLLGRSRTRDTGRASVPLASEGASALVVWSEGFVRKDVELAAPPSEPLHIELSRGGSAILRVRDSDGSPVPRFRFTVLPQALFDELTRSTGPFRTSF